LLTQRLSKLILRTPKNRGNNMLKHIGRHGDRKVAILFREVPGEDHMCLVIYPETLPSHIHDSIMKTLESPVGQQASNLAEALHRNLLPDGRVQLEALHREGMIKKIPSNQVIVTPNAASSIKLDELNRIVKELETGDEARKRLQQLDDSKGIVDPETKRQAEREFKRQQLESAQRTQAPLQSSPESALDDRTLATNMLSQAKRMEAEAKGLLSEAARMKKDAQRMHPGVNLVDAAELTPVVDHTAAEPVTKPKKPRARAKDAVQ
jgi:hypothetical protein